MSPNQLNTAFFVGAGCEYFLRGTEELSCWQPIFAAINSHAKADLIHDSESANFYFAFLVNQRRLFHWLKHSSEPAAISFREGTSSEQLNSSVGTRKEEHDTIKHAIAAALREAASEGSLRLRPRFEEELYRPQWGNVLCLTTNWDRVLATCTARAPIHLHGSTDNPADLFLPSEITEENYRSDQERKTHGKAVSDCWSSIEQADNLCLYGLSLSALDADLGQAISMGFSEHLSKPLAVHIFNLEEACIGVERRLRLLCPERAAVTFTSHPVA
jgi:hypothetical protein